MTMSPLWYAAHFMILTRYALLSQYSLFYNKKTRTSIKKSVSEKYPILYVVVTLYS